MANQARDRVGARLEVVDWQRPDQPARPRRQCTKGRSYARPAGSHHDPRSHAFFLQCLVGVAATVTPKQLGLCRARSLLKAIRNAPLRTSIGSSDARLLEFLPSKGACSHDFQIILIVQQTIRNRSRSDTSFAPSSAIERLAR